MNVGPQSAAELVSAYSISKLVPLTYRLSAPLDISSYNEDNGIQTYIELEEKAAGNADIEAIVVMDGISDAWVSKTGVSGTHTVGTVSGERSLRLQVIDLDCRLWTRGLSPRVLQSGAISSSEIFMSQPPAGEERTIGCA